MAKKSITTYQPTETHSIEFPDGTEFPLEPSVPGAVLLDFIGNADDENPAAMANTVKALLDEAIAEESREAFNAYIRDKKNNVTLETLAEIAGFAAEVLSGGNPQQRPASSLTG